MSSALDEVFRRLDTDLDGLLSREELAAFLLMTEGCELSEQVFRWLLEQFDSRGGGLTPEGFRAVYMYLFDTSDGDPETIWRDLIFMGYDRSLELVYARTCVVAFHATGEFVLHPQPFNQEAFKQAMELPIRELGKCQDLAQGRCKLFTRRAGYSGVSFAVENCSDTAVTFTLDCSDSTNVMSHRGKLRASQMVGPGETKVLHHLMPEHTFEQWSWSTKYALDFHDQP